MRRSLAKWTTAWHARRAVPARAAGRCCSATTATRPTTWAAWTRRSQARGRDRRMASGRGGTNPPSTGGCVTRLYGRSLGCPARFAAAHAAAEVPEGDWFCPECDATMASGLGKDLAVRCVSNLPGLTPAVPARAQLQLLPQGLVHLAGQQNRRELSWRQSCRVPLQHAATGPSPLQAVLAPEPASLLRCAVGWSRQAACH